MASKEIVWKKLELQKANRLTLVYHAGLNPREFSLATRVQEVETICISLLCDEVMRCVVEADEKRRPILFSDLSYIWSGVLFIFKAQIKVLYDESMRQAHYTLEYVKRSQAIITLWQDPTKSSLSNKGRSRKTNESIKHLPNKRVKFADAEFDYQSLNDSEVDDDTTIQILQTSKIMNRDQISIREVISEPLPNPLSQNSEFEAAENGSTQTFLAIGELIAKGRSIVDAIQSVSHMVTGDNEPRNEPYDEYGYYEPMTLPHSSTPPHSPLPDIDICHEESDVVIPNQDKSVTMNVERPRSASSNNISLPSLPSQLPPHKPVNKGAKRRRVVFDVVRQILAGVEDPENDKKLMRCTNAMMDCVTKTHIFRELKLINFNMPAHSLRELKPRGARQVAALMVGLSRVKKIRRKEPDDMNMVQNFLSSFGCEPQKDVHDLQLEDLRQKDQPRQNGVDRRSIRKRSSPSVPDSHPQPCNERLSHTSELCDMDFEYQDEPMDDPDVPAFEPEPIVDPPEHELNLQTVESVSPIIDRQEKSVMAVPQREPNLPIVNRSPIMDRPEKSAMVKNVSETRNFTLVSENMPRRVLRLLNQFVTVNTNEPSKSPSQALLMLNNQKNRDKWGLKGVLQNLFRLWYRKVHPIGMTELLHPQRQKIAAALAFYSIMELNSPRIGLIKIEKAENSNTVYNIVMSDKLLNLLGKSLK